MTIRNIKWYISIWEYSDFHFELGKMKTQGSN